MAIWKYIILRRDWNFVWKKLQKSQKFRQLLFKEFYSRVIFSEFLMDLHYLAETVSISGLSDHQKFDNACARRNNNVWKNTNIIWLLCKLEIYTFRYKTLRFVKSYENFWTESSFDKLTHIKYITRLLDSLNNNCGNFFFGFDQTLC